jgi:hypothetical protein
MSHFEHLRYMIIKADEVADVDFSEVLETAPDTLRYSVDGVYTFFKWEGDVIPSSIEALTYKDGEYTHHQIMDILNSPEWISNPDL